MTDSAPSKRRRLYVAAEITSIICDAIRDAAELFADEELDIIENSHDNKWQRFERFVAHVADLGMPGVLTVLEDHGLSGHASQVEDDIRTILTMVYEPNPDTNVKVETGDTQATVASPYTGVVRVAGLLDCSMQDTLAGMPEEKLAGKYRQPSSARNEVVRTFGRFRQSLARMFRRSR